VAAPVLDGQGQIDQRLDRPIGTQHRIGQFEQRIRPRGQTVIEALAEPSKHPKITARGGIVHTDHDSPCVDLLLPDRKRINQGLYP
jgi:hypothetical protein